MSIAAWGMALSDYWSYPDRVLSADAGLGVAPFQGPQTDEDPGQNGERLSRRADTRIGAANRRPCTARGKACCGRSPRRRHGFATGTVMARHWRPCQVALACRPITEYRPVLRVEDAPGVLRGVCQPDAGAEHFQHLLVVDDPCQQEAVVEGGEPDVVTDRVVDAVDRPTHIVQSLGRIEWGQFRTARDASTTWGTLVGGIRFRCPGGASTQRDHESGPISAGRCRETPRITLP